ncbi:restriction endonuclease [Streptomyces sp. NBC_00879]|uniref:nSTAND3 domain-containing NTPase n=1 Tax=Streptomyces sp. NBC_00879 TaxID=2975855 RepID=UPI00386EA796|nr:restriction endonuclease [Streptomyces sp. NBC_00879]
MSAPDYDFKSLSPYDFEVLARDLLSAHDGVTYSTYRIGADGGVDLQAHTKAGLVIAQCKHTPDATKATLVRVARAEREKIARLNHRPKRYVFVTSAHISPSDEHEVAETLDSVADTVEVRTRGWLNTVLSKHQHLERRHFKLWLTSTQAIAEMLRGGVFLRGESRIRRIQRNYLRFVHHDICTQAEAVLSSTACVLLTGAPGAGKTAIAEYLLLQWWHRGYRIIVDPRDVDRWWEWVEDDTPTVFFFDDTWGQTRYGDHGSRHYDSDVYEFIETVIDKHTDGVPSKLLIMTSRIQVLHDTVRLSDASRRALELISKCRVSLERLSAEVRSRILFNHLHHGITDSAARRKLAQGGWWHDIVRHRNYSPRIVELIIKRNDHGDSETLINDLIQSLNNPLEVWGSSFKALPEYDQQLLLTLSVMDSQHVPWQHLDRRLENIATTESGFDAAIERLDGAWITCEYVEETQYFSLADPSQRDYLTWYLSTSPSAMSRLIKNTVNFRDLAPICSQGRAIELASQQRLFSLGEGLLRNVLDTCAEMLLTRVKDLWQREIDNKMPIFDSGDGDGELFALLFANLIQAMHYHADRYKTKANSAILPEDWFARELNELTAAGQLAQIRTVGELADTLTLLHDAFRHFAEHRVHPSIAKATVELEELCRSFWESRDPQSSRMAGDRGQLEDLVQAVVDNAEALVQFFVRPKLHGMSTDSIDQAMAVHIRQSDELEELAERIEVIESAFGFPLPTSREAINARVDSTDWDPSPPHSATVNAYFAQSTHPRTTVSSTAPIDALFRSLAPPEEPRGLS